MPNDRIESSYRLRVEAAAMAKNRAPVAHEANADEARYGTACYPMSFTKGLDHDQHTGLVADTADFEVFRTAIDNAFAEPFTSHVPVPAPPAGISRRKWEAPTAGVVYDLEGPDAQAVTMPPAPELGSAELTFEMAEVYELALVRDEPFTAFQKQHGTASPKLDASIERLNDLDFAEQNFPGTRGRKTTFEYKFDVQTAFRGSSPGVEKGPYLSQFMLIGTKGDPKHGLIGYGAQVIDQRVLQAKKDDDYMMKWDDWMFVQRGFAPQLPGGIGQDLVDGAEGKPASRFICTPRDLATYVHVDQLYQAYLNAALILLGQGAPFDPGFDLLSGMGGGMLKSPGATEYVDYNAGGFALWGGPHILSLVTEVATRGLKAVRFQKFNVHLRLRPEALGARMERVTEIGKSSPSLCGAFDQMHSDLADVLAAVETHNEGLTGSKSKLLPMAFAEGSPMHPTYGAGHATVAGACVTMLKAFFDTSAVSVKVIDPDDNVSAHFWNKAQIFNALDKEDKRVIAGAYQPHCDGTPGHSELKFHSYGEYKLTGSGAKKKVVYHPDDMYSDDHVPCPLTLEGELNKLAANISIGRNMAGVHYYSDYYDSARMGEEIALGILEEQALCYPTDKFVVSVPTFDGDAVRIGRR